jgi:hypothetical protein
MKDNNTSPSKEEEIDLGQLFNLIGRGFSKLFEFLKYIIDTFFKWILLFLLFLRANTIKILIGTFIGLILGGIYEYGYKIPTYMSSMTVQPNFGSDVQLYKNIDYYQSLVLQNDFERLATSLEISEDEARSLKLIESRPYSNDNQTLLAYKNFINQLDTTTVKMVNYETFAKEQPIESFRYHIVTVKSTNKFIFNKLRTPIISSIIKNQYYDKVKSTALSNLISRKEALEDSMNELDSLKSIYKEVLLAESKKESSGTNIFMANTAANNKEFEVFEKYMSMNSQLTNVNKQLTDENEVINVVSSFNPVGMTVRGLHRNFAVIGFVVGFLFVLLVASLKEINKLLSAYEGRIKNKS